MRYSAEIHATIAELLKHGATFLKVTTGGKHRRVHYRYGARESYMDPNFERALSETIALFQQVKGRGR